MSDHPDSPDWWKNRRRLAHWMGTAVWDDVVARKMGQR